MFLSPGVTPWETTLPGVTDGANNPGIRVFEYDTQTLLVKVIPLSYIISIVLISIFYHVVFRNLFNRCFPSFFLMHPGHGDLLPEPDLC